jgi:hypothetical protein
MAEIRDCIGKNVKISKGSITIKSEDGKTCGVVRNIVSLYDMQPNKQMEHYGKLRKLGLHGKISIKDCIISNNTLYVFRNVKSKLFYEQYGYMTEEEKTRAEQNDVLYNMIRENGIEVIECIFL